MQFSQTLIANASDSSGLGITGTLFWVFLIAAIVWLLIRLLLKSDSPAEGEAEDSAQAAESETAPAPEPEAVSAPEPKQKTAESLPSQAFTIWTKPGLAPEPEATPEPEPEEPEATPAPEPEPEEPKAIPEPEPEPAKAIPSQAFTIWTKPGAALAPSKAETADDSKDGAEDDATDANSIPVLDTATAEEAAAQFQADLDSGNARQDDALGIVYDSAPDDADDLKEIKGVAKVLEGKLHGFGIYKFKQIAFWTDTAVAEFAQRLTFKDRIYRDDWIAQAKKFHEKKYGEKL